MIDLKPPRPKFWWVRKEEFITPRAITDNTAVHEANALCKPLLMACLNNFAAPIEQCRIELDAITESADFTLYALECILPKAATFYINTIDQADVNNYMHHQSHQKSRIARIATRAAQAAVACAALTVDMVTFAMNEAVAADLFADRKSKNSGNTMSHMIRYICRSATRPFPPLNSVRPETPRPSHQRIDAVLVALEIAIATCQLTEGDQAAKCSYMQHMTSLGCLVWELDTQFRDTRDGLDELHTAVSTGANEPQEQNEQKNPKGSTESTESTGTVAKIGTSSSVAGEQEPWWDGTASSANRSATAICKLAQMTKNAAECVDKVEGIVTMAKVVLKGATESVRDQFMVEILPVPRALKDEFIPGPIYGPCSRRLKESAIAAKTQADATLQLAANMRLGLQ